MPTTVHDTFVLTRTYPVAPEAVFAAFADPAIKRRWMAESASHAVDTFESDFRVGGVERASYRMGPTTPFPGAVISSEGSHHEITPHRRIVIASTMAMNGNRFSTALITFEIAQGGNGATLTLTHQAAFFENADGPAMRQQGWKELLDRIGKVLAQ